MTSCNQLFSTQLTTDNAYDYFEIYSPDPKFEHWGTQATITANIKGLDGWIYNDVVLVIEFWLVDDKRTTFTIDCNVAGKGAARFTITGIFEDYSLDTLSYKIIEVSGSVSGGYF